MSKLFLYSLVRVSEAFTTPSLIFLSSNTVHVVPRCRSPNPCLPQQQDTICCKNLILTLLKMGKRLPETCRADLVDQQIIVASSWFFYITLPTLMMHGQTQIKFKTLVCQVSMRSSYVTSTDFRFNLRIV